MKQLNLKLSVFYGLTNILVLNLVLAVICRTPGLNSYFLSTSPVFSVLWLILAPANNLYNFSRNSNYRLRLLNHLKCHLAFSGILILICFSFDLHEQFKAVTIPLIIAYPIINLGTVALLMYIIGYLRRNGRNVKKILIVGTGNASSQLFRYIESNPDLGYRIIGVLSDDADGNFHEKLPVSGSWQSLGDILGKFKLNEIFVTIPSSEPEKISFIVQQADFFGVRMRLIPDYHQLLGNSFSIATFGNLPVINMRAISLDKHYLSLAKRMFDIAFSVLAIIFLAPLMLLLMFVIALDSSGPVFYCPVRIGKGGKEFKLYKFRSMYTEYTGTISGSTKKNDPRLTFVGAFIRRYSLDELPQFFNVLLGNMSVVGPRPHRILLNRAMQKEVDNYMLRHYLKPGITGWAQVNGWRGPTETEEEKIQRTNHDLWYVNNWSMALDMRIVCRTIFDSKTHKKAF